MPSQLKTSTNHGRNAVADSVTIDMSSADDGEQTPSKTNFTSWNESIRYLFTDILNPRGYFKPMNSKRLLVWLMLALIISPIMVALFKLGGLEEIESFLETEILILSVFVYGLEPLKRFLAAALSKFPKYEAKPIRALEAPEQRANIQTLTEEDRAEQTMLEELSKITNENVATLKLRYKKNKKLMVMIPCHQSMIRVGKKRLSEVIQSAIKQVPPQNIYIVDNGPWPEAPDETNSVVKSIHAKINCEYFAYPGKTTALMKAVIDVLAHRPDLTHVLTFDNDVTVPDNYEFRQQFFRSDRRVKAIVYPIRAVNPDGPHRNLLTRWQDIDYVMAGANKSYLDHFRALDKPHGAVWLCEIKVLYDILIRHNGQFRGEDWQLGLLLRNLYSPDGALQLRLDSACFFETDAPQKYFSADGRWPQQVRSWMIVPYLWPLKYIVQPFLTQWRTSSLSELIVMKLEQGYELWSLFSTVLRYPLMAIQATNPKFWIAFGALQAADLVLILITNYAMLPKYLRNDLKAILSYPVHKQIDSLMQFFALLRTLLIEFPKNKKYPSIKALIDDGKLPSLNTFDDSRTMHRVEINLRQPTSSELSPIPSLTVNADETDAATRFSEDVRKIIGELNQLLEQHRRNALETSAHVAHPTVIRDLAVEPYRRDKDVRRKKNLDDAPTPLRDPSAYEREIEERVYDTLYAWDPCDVEIYTRVIPHHEPNCSRAITPERRLTTIDEVDEPPSHTYGSRSTFFNSQDQRQVTLHHSANFHKEEVTRKMRL